MTYHRDNGFVQYQKKRSAERDHVALKRRSWSENQQHISGRIGMAERLLRTLEDELEQRDLRVREMINALLQHTSSILSVTDADGSAEINTSGSFDFYAEVRNFEIDLIKGALVRSGGSQTVAAKDLNVNLTTLNAMIKRYGLEEFCSVPRLGRSRRSAAEER